MVYKKYTRKNGKVYGPYLYHNKRVGDKIVTFYHGKGEREKNYKPIAIGTLAIFLIGLIAFAIYFFASQVNFSPVEQVSINSDLPQIRGEKLYGKIEGETQSFNPSKASVKLSYLGDNGRRVVFEKPFLEVTDNFRLVSEKVVEGESEKRFSQGVEDYSEIVIFYTLDSRKEIFEEKEDEEIEESEELVCQSDSDCEQGDKCLNGVCSTPRPLPTSPRDISGFSNSCGNRICQSFETCGSCPSDCGFCRDLTNPPIIYVFDDPFDTILTPPSQGRVGEGPDISGGGGGPGPGIITPGGEPVYPVQPELPNGVGKGGYGESISIDEDPALIITGESIVEFEETLSESEKINKAFLSKTTPLTVKGIPKLVAAFDRKTGAEISRNYIDLKEYKENIFVFTTNYAPTKKKSIFDLDLGKFNEAEVPRGINELEVTASVLFDGDEISSTKILFDVKNYVLAKLVDKNENYVVRAVRNEKDARKPENLVSFSSQVLKPDAGSSGRVQVFVPEEALNVRIDSFDNSGNLISSSTMESGNSDSVEIPKDEERSSVEDSSNSIDVEIPSAGVDLIEPEIIETPQIQTPSSQENAEDHNNIITADAVIEFDDVVNKQEIYYSYPAPILVVDDFENGKKVSFTSVGDSKESNLVWKGIPILASIEIPKINYKERAVVYTSSGLELVPSYIDEDNIYWTGEFGEEYVIIIQIVKAEHLNQNREFISNIFDQVYQLDDVWSEPIQDGEFVRVSFEKPLTNVNDITVYPRTKGGSPSIEVYEMDSDVLIETFENLEEERYNKVYLTSLPEGDSQDVFDLKIVGGSVEFDHIIDPTNVSDCATLSIPNEIFSLNQSISAVGSCFAINATNVTLNLNGFNITGAGGLGVGILINANKTKILNGSIYGFSAGISSSGFNGVILENLLLRSNSVQGISLVSSSNSVLRNVAARDNNIGIFLSSNAGETTLNQSIINSSFVNNIDTDLYIATLSSSYFNKTYLLDSNVEKYLIAPANFGAQGLVFEKTSYGKFNFLQGIGTSGSNLSDDLFIGNNTARLSNNFNYAANITLYNIGNRGFNSPEILRNGIPCENICYNFTALNATNVVFNVSRFGNYNISERIGRPLINFTYPTPPNGSINYGTTISVNVSSLSNNSLNPHYTFVDFNKDLLFWARMDDLNGSGSPIDLIGRNNLSFVGSPNEVKGRFGSGLELKDGDGINTPIAGNDFFNIADRNVSISLWVNITGTQSERRYILEKFTGSTHGYWFGLNPDSNSLYFRHIEAVSPGDLVLSSGLVNDSLWHHVVLTFDGSFGIMYLDGNVISSEAYSPLINWNQQLAIGHLGGGTESLNGSIDELMYFNRTLTAGEIKSLYDARMNQYYRDFTQLKDGDYYLKGFVVESNGLMNSTETIFFNNNVSDLTAPNVHFLSPPTPLNGSLVSDNFFPVSLFSNDTSKHFSFVEMNKDLLLWMRMDEVGAVGKVYDNSSYAYNGTAVGNAVQAQGLYGQGFSFDGSGDYINISSGFSPPGFGKKVTYGAWIYPREIKANEYIAASTIRGPLSWYIHNSSGSIDFVWDLDSGDFQEEHHYSPFGVAANTWSHVVVSVNETSVTYYLNGQQFNSITVLDLMLYQTFESVVIGAGQDGGGYGFNGTIDEFIVFNRSLNSGEVAALYNATVNKYSNSFTSMSNGNYTLKGYASDIFGFVNVTKNWNFTVNITVKTVPNVNFTFPTPSNGSFVQGGVLINVSSSSVRPQHYTLVDNNADLILWMRMDDTNLAGNPVSISSVASEGILKGAATINSTGLFGNASWFNMTGNITISNSNLFNVSGQAFSIVGSYYRGGQATCRSLIEHGADYSICIIPGTGGNLRFSTTNLTGQTHNCASVGSPGNFVWTQFAVVYNGTAKNIYFNGVLNVSCPYSSEVRFSNNDLVISGSSVANAFSGGIDDMMMFKRALTPAEISALYNANDYPYSNNFTNLTFGYNDFKAYSVETGGLMNSTETRRIFVEDSNNPTVNLEYPRDSSSVINRKPFFNWTPNGNDANWKYDFNISLVGGIDLCSQSPFYAENLTARNYTLNFTLDCFYDYGRNNYYLWTVRAKNGAAVGPWAQPFKLNLTSYIDLVLNNSNMSFGNINIFVGDNTTDNIPLPFVLENRGNVKVNVSINATDLWDSYPNNSSNIYYRFKVDNYTSGGNTNVSFDWANSVTSFTPMPNSTNPLKAISKLNWTDGADLCEVDILIAVPSSELPGNKDSSITFTASLAE